MKIDLTEIEINLIMHALLRRRVELQESHSISGNLEEAVLAAELIDLEHDLFEALHRCDDGWGDEPPSQPDAALDMIQAGIDAREQAKASSRAAERRNERMMKGTASPVSRDFSNDPIDW
jgi:hypothetical protein